MLMAAMENHYVYDVIVIGAGISGINAAYRLKTLCPNLSYTILEGRQKLGGTWDLFKYPGVRSDSDLYTFGFVWQPWNRPSHIADAKTIRDYLHESAEKHGIYTKIQFGISVKTVTFSKVSGIWTVEPDARDQLSATSKLCARFLIMCTGYYDYKTPRQAKIPGIDSFKGQIIHPQFWPDDLSLTGKKVVIIGSGATSVTLVPSVAEQAEAVIMLQRSPTYILSQPQHDTSMDFLCGFLPVAWIAMFLRCKYLLLPFLFLKFCKAFPNAARRLLLARSRQSLPSGWQIEPDFSPQYGPWDQRLCICPDGDFYKSLHKGNVSIITDRIEKVTANSIVLTKHKTLMPDVIITATGLQMQLAGGIRIIVDGSAVDLSKQHAWNATLMEDCPNMAFCLGYTNQSWTLGADCAALLTMRILKKLQATGKKTVVPVLPEDPKFIAQPIMNLSSTYVQCALDDLPKAGSAGPWRPRTSYFTDYRRSVYGTITDGLLYS